jgi:recombination protein RecT
MGEKATVVDDKKGTAGSAPVARTLSGLMNDETVKKKFREMLGNKAPGFISSILQVANGNDKLKAADPMSIFNAAATAAALDLPINPNLGFAWLVPYSGKAQFQLGYKGFVQLAMRSAQYKRLNVVEIYASQFKSWNPLTEDLDVDFTQEPAGDVVGYCAFFRLINGMEKTTYWSKARVTEHAKKYSKSFDKADGQWRNNFDDMAKKTMIKLLLSKWGVLSIEMQIAIKVDQAVINDEAAEDVTYVDAEVTAEDKADAATKATEDAINGKGKTEGGGK